RQAGGRRPTGDRPAADERPGICVPLRGRVRRTSLLKGAAALALEALTPAISRTGGFPNRRLYSRPSSCKGGRSSRAFPLAVRAIGLPAFQGRRKNGART